MLRGIFYLFLVLCGYASGIKSSILIQSNYSPEIQEDRLVIHHAVAIKEESDIQSRHRLQRGIALVDEDFDVPPGSIRNEKDYKLNELFDHIGYESTLGSSGDGADDSEKEVTTGAMEIHLKTKSNDLTTEKTSVQELTKMKLKSTIASTPKPVVNEIEGSGDNVLENTKEYSTTEKITTEPAKEAHEPIPDICLNTTCNSRDLLIHFTDVSNLIPEGTNLTFSCMNNNSDYGMLFWYKSNGSIHFLQAFGREELLLLNIPDIKTIHSGIYMCVKWISKESCCSLETHLTVYEVPKYTYHLIILALLTLAFLLICIFLAVRQSVTIKKYKEEFAQKHGSVKQQLL